MTSIKCSICPRSLHKNKALECEICHSKFHFKCCSVNDKKIHLSSLPWYCSSCNIFPFQQLNNAEIVTLFSDPIATNNKLRCFACQKKIKKNVRYKKCCQCENPFEIKCSTKSSSIWMCLKCSFSHLSFCNLSNNEMHLSLHGLSENEQDFLKDLPNFSIKTLIDSLPGENFSKDDFISDTIISKYYSPIEFKSKKIGNKSFSMVHFNISSLQLHIDELRTLLQILDHPFDIIAIT